MTFGVDDVQFIIQTRTLMIMKVEQMKKLTQAGTCINSMAKLLLMEGRRGRQERIYVE